MKTTMMILGSILLGGACGGSDDLTAGETASTVSRQFCEKAYVECPSEMPAGFTDFYGDTASECEAILAEFVGSEEAINASVAAGRIEFDAATASTCIDDSAALIDGATCEQFFAGGGLTADSCDAALAGTVADGGDCYTSLDCAGETLYCVFVDGADVGTCDAGA